MTPRAELPPVAAPAERRRSRDHAAKLLGLLDFSSSAATPESLDDTLAVLLFSLMGEFAAAGGAVLVGQSRGVDGELVVRAAKGRGAGALLGRRFAGSDATLGDRPWQAGSGDLDPASGSAALAAELHGALLVPIVSRGRLLGALALGARLHGVRYAADEVELVRLVANIAGTVIANQLLYEELREANRKLRRHIFDLHAIFDVSRELNASPEAETVCRNLAQTAMAHALVSQCLILLAEEGKLRVVFSRGVSLTPRDVEALEAIGADDAFADSNALDALKSRGRIAHLIPLRAGGSTRGFLGIGTRKDGRALALEELEFLSTLGNQAVTALDNLKLHQDRAVRERLQRELGIARDIQVGLFPKHLPDLPGWSLAAASEPCYEVGGDYYDALLVPGGLVVALGDVAGKSIPAALLMSVIQATIRSLARRGGETPSTLLDALNRRLVESTQPGKFASFFLGVLDPASARFTYANGGHNPPLLVRASGEVERLTVGGPVLGIFEEAKFDEASTDLAPGDMVFTYTDGVTEAMDKGDVEFGEERLQAMLVADRSRPALDVLRRVVRAVREHAHGLEAGDDLTALVLQRATGPAEARWPA